jgi:hypothetical protein
MLMATLGSDYFHAGAALSEHRHSDSPKVDSQRQAYKCPLVPFFPARLASPPPPTCGRMCVDIDTPNFSPGRRSGRGFLFPGPRLQGQLQFALGRQLFAPWPGKPIEEGTVLLHEADNHVRACPLCAAGWRSGVAVNLLADFEGVSGAVRFFHPAI